MEGAMTFEPRIVARAKSILDLLDASLTLIRKT